MCYENGIQEHCIQTKELQELLK
ncbi:unnamed protein product, partial [Allacma fusca]